MNKKVIVYFFCGICLGLFALLIYPGYFILRYLPPEVLLDKKQLAQVFWILATGIFIWAISILVSYILCWRERKKISIWFVILGLLLLFLSVSFVIPALVIITPIIISLLLVVLIILSFVFKNPIFLPKCFVYENPDFIPTLTEAERKALDRKVLKVFLFTLPIAIALWFLGRRFGL